MISIKNLSFLKRFLPICFITISLLSMEGICFLLYRDTKLDDVFKIINEDRSLFWRQRPNLSNQNFQGSKVSTDQDGFRITKDAPGWYSSEIRIAVLGASPSFGWGVDDGETYSSRLQHLLNSLNPSKKISLLNASQIGYSSHQGLLLFKQIVVKKKPTHIILTYVINDLDYFRFFRNVPIPDNQLKSDDAWKIYSRNILRNLYTYKLLSNVFAYFTSLRNQDSYPNLAPRVSLIDYQRNIEEIIQIAVKNNIIPILLKFPVNLPNLNLTKEQLESKITAGHDVYEEKKLKALLIRKQSEEYNQMMENISHQKNLLLIDIVRSFQKEKEYLFIDPKFDPIHPNRIGHEIIAQIIFRNLKPLLIKNNE